jgi:hypothetical protein
MTGPPLPRLDATTVTEVGNDLPSPHASPPARQVVCDLCGCVVYEFWHLTQHDFDVCDACWSTRFPSPLRMCHAWVHRIGAVLLDEGEIEDEDAVEAAENTAASTEPSNDLTQCAREDDTTG